MLLRRLMGGGLNMYVCMCKAVTDRQIRHAVLEGADRLSEVSQRLGVCTGCGKCADHVCALIQTTLAEASVSTPVKNYDYPHACLSAC